MLLKCYLFADLGLIIVCAGVWGLWNGAKAALHKVEVYFGSTAIVVPGLLRIYQGRDREHFNCYTL